MINPFKQFSKKEKIFWFLSLTIVLLSNFFSADSNLISLIAAGIGVTALLCNAKGNAVGLILIIIFSTLYGIISYSFRYWGELITYAGMSLPMAVWSLISWLRHPSSENNGVVQIQQLTIKHKTLLSIFGFFITIFFFHVLSFFNTPNIYFSTISVTTSFLAASMTMLRTPWFAFFYALNDIILIILWIYASLSDSSYITVVVNFSIFLVNDLYTFYCWKKREQIQLFLKQKK